MVSYMNCTKQIYWWGVDFIIYICSIFSDFYFIFKFRVNPSYSCHVKAPKSIKRANLPIKRNEFQLLKHNVFLQYGHWISLYMELYCRVV